MTGKLQRLFGPAGPTGLGLEIGALDGPLLRKGEYDVLYVDYAETEVIRANQSDPSVRIDNIVDVDIVWGGARLACAVGRPVDFVVASHVIEHVPDLIGWLGELAEALRPGGVLGLAIPDKRFTFDALRHETVLSEAVEAWLLGAKQPSLRQVFDAAALSVPVDGAQVWSGRFEPGARREEVLARLRPALGLVRSLHAKPRYNDAHCWVFTPQSFLDLAEELAALDLFPFVIDGFHPTEPGAAEFLVRLVRAEAVPDDAIQASVRAARDRLPPDEADRTDPPAAPAPQPDPRIESLQAELDRIYASKSWRVTKPLRTLARKLRE
ncbi:MAG: methyltransferase type 12 [Phenylobacterium sp.]|nr:methyltransferase type 12 [Phenylobacterium sp.]